MADTQLPIRDIQIRFVAVDAYGRAESLTSDKLSCVELSQVQDRLFELCKIVSAAYRLQNIVELRAAHEAINHQSNKEVQPCTETSY